MGLEAVSGPGLLAACPWAPLLLMGHLARYPAMRVDDAYKLLHQATMGSEHAVRDRAGPAAWMAREWEHMGEGPPEPMVDTLSGRFARVHLRPWRNAGGTPDPVVDAFVATANGARPDSAALSCALGQLLQLSARGRTPWDTTAVRTLIASMQRAGYPATHHSDAYEAAYRPAYRVVEVGRLAALLAALPRASP